MFSPIEWSKAQKVDIQENFINFEKSITATIEKQYRKWLEHLGDCSRLTFNTSLLKYDAKSGTFDCNINKTVLNIVHEAKYWSLFDIQIPYYLANISKKFHELIRHNFENILTLLLEYYSLINSLSENEMMLFSGFKLVVDKKLSSGTQKINWLSDQCDDFIRQSTFLICEVLFS